MRFLLLFVVVCALSSGCGGRTQPLVIYNGCTGSWIRVDDGNGNLLVDRLDYGLETSVDVHGYEGRTIELLAVGFELVTDRPLGSATSSRSIPRGGGSVTGPSQLSPWRVTSLQTTDPKGGCKK